MATKEQNNNITAIQNWYYSQKKENTIKDTTLIPLWDSKPDLELDTKIAMKVIMAILIALLLAVIAITVLIAKDKIPGIEGGWDKFALGCGAIGLSIANIVFAKALYVKTEKADYKNDKMQKDINDVIYGICRDDDNQGKSYEEIKELAKTKFSESDRTLFNTNYDEAINLIHNKICEGIKQEIPSTTKDVDDLHGKLKNLYESLTSENKKNREENNMQKSALNMYKQIDTERQKGRKVADIEEDFNKLVHGRWNWVGNRQIFDKVDGTILDSNYDKIIEKLTNRILVLPNGDEKNELVELKQKLESAKQVLETEIAKEKNPLVELDKKGKEQLLEKSRLRREPVSERSEEQLLKKSKLRIDEPKRPQPKTEPEPKPKQSKAHL